MTTQNVSNTVEFVPTIVSKDIQVAFTGLTPMKDIVSYLSTDDLQEGKAVSIPVAGAFTAGKKLPGVSITPTAGGSSSVLVNIDQHAYVYRANEDVLVRQATPARIAAFALSAAQGLAQTVETDLMSTYADAASSVGTAGTPITAATLKSAKLKLDQAKVPFTDRFVVIGAEQMDELLSDDNFVRYDANGKSDNAMISGVVGQVWGFNILQTSFDTKTGVGLDEYHGIAFHKSAIAYGEQKSPSVETERDLDIAATKILVDMLYGFKVVREDAIVEIKS